MDTIIFDKCSWMKVDVFDLMLFYKVNHESCSNSERYFREAANERQWGRFICRTSNPFA